MPHPSLHQGGDWRLAALALHKNYLYLLALDSVQSTFRNFSCIYTYVPGEWTRSTVGGVVVASVAKSGQASLWTVGNIVYVDCTNYQ